MSDIEIPIWPGLILQTKEFMVWILLGLLVLMYFAPSIVAILRKHRNKLPIFVLNLFVGWTFLGWVGALVWSCTTQKRDVPYDQVV